MSKLSETEPMFQEIGDPYIDSNLRRTERRILQKQSFGRPDMEFIKYLLEEKISCEVCSSAVVSVFLHIRSRKKVSCDSAEWAIMTMIYEKRNKINLWNSHDVLCHISLPLSYVKSPRKRRGGPFYAEAV